jgi:nitrous oxidase accessory protein NosD
VISGNMIEECNGTAVILDRDCYGIAVSANVVAHHLGGGVDLKDANGCTISANSFVLCHGFGLQASAESTRNSISGNAFANTYIGGGKLKRPILEHENKMQIDAGAGVVLDGSTDTAITGNTFTGLDYEAVKATNGAKRLLVTSNILAECGRRLEPSKPWIFIEDYAGSMIKENLVSK